MKYLFDGSLVKLSRGDTEECLYLTFASSLCASEIFSALRLVKEDGRSAKICLISLRVGLLCRP